MDDSIMGRLQAMSDKLSPTDRIIAGYFIRHQNTLMDLTMPQIASDCGVSKPAIVRLCKKMGYLGYKSLLTALAAEKALRGSGQGSPQLMSLQGLSVAEICDLSTRLAIEIVQDVRRGLSVSNMQRAVDLLLGSHSLTVFGWDNAAVNMHDAQMKFARLGFQTAIALDAYSRGLLLHALRPGDVVMLFTQRGYCADSHLVLSQIHQEGARAIIITSDAEGYDLAEGDILFSTNVKGHLPGTGDMDHTLAGNIVMTTMYMITGARLCEQGRLKLDNR